jgi:hypothetical protein
MTISASRFKSLDQQTNVPIADFLAANSSAIYNSLNQTATEVTAEMKAFFESSSQTSSVRVAEAADALVRGGKNAMGAIRDIGSFSGKDIDKLVSGLFKDNPKAQAVFNKLGPKCQTKGLGTGSIGKPYSLDVDCGGKKRKGKKDGCNSSEYADILNKATNGQYGAAFKDTNTALQNLVSLSKFGYDVNLCGVFSALTGDLDKNVLSRASAAVMGHLATSGNVLGVFDLAGASAGLHTAKEYPGVIKDTFNNFVKPSEVKKSDLPDVADRLMGSMELIKETWTASEWDSMLSTAETGDYNNEVDEVLRAKQLGYSFGGNNLDVIPSSDFSYMATAYAMNNSSGIELFA